MKERTDTSPPTTPPPTNVAPMGFMTIMPSTKVEAIPSMDFEVKSMIDDDILMELVLGDFDLPFADSAIDTIDLDGIPVGAWI